MHQTLDVVQKRASIWNINSLGTNILQIPAEQPSQMLRVFNKHHSEKVFLRDMHSVLPLLRGQPLLSPSLGVLPAVPALASALIASSKQFYLIFRSLILFSLSLFLRISMNWLKKCSWSFFFWTRRNLWSLPYFSANSLNVVLQKRQRFESCSLADVACRKGMATRQLEAAGCHGQTQVLSTDPAPRAQVLLAAQPTTHQPPAYASTPGL